MGCLLSQSKLALGLVLVSSIAGGVSGCADRYTNDAAFVSGEDREAVDLVASSHQVVDRLVDSSQQVLDQAKPIMVASLVNVSDLELSLIHI